MYYITNYISFNIPNNIKITFNLFLKMFNSSYIIIISMSAFLALDNSLVFLVLIAISVAGTLLYPNPSGRIKAKLSNISTTPILKYIFSK